MNDIKFPFYILYEIISKDEILKKIDRDDILSKNISDKNKEKLIDLLLEKFCNEGLDCNDEPNTLGVEIEKIIDFFNK